MPGPHPARRSLGRPRLPNEVRAVYPFDHNWFRAGGYTLHYLDEGGRRDPVVLLLHGNPTWSFLYRHFIPPLVDAGYRVIAPDYLGFGLSDKPSDERLYTIPHHVSRLVALLDDLRIDDAVLFAQDWGGPIGFGAELARPDLIKGLVLGNTFWGEASNFQRSVPMWRALHGPVAGPLLLGKRGMFVEALRLSGPRDMPQAVLDAYALPFSAGGSRVGTLAFPRAISTGPGHPMHPLVQRILEILPKMDVPARLVWGAEDAVFPPDEQGARFAELLPRAGEVELVDGARHFVQEYDPEACVQAILSVAEEAL